MNAPAHDLIQQVANAAAVAAVKRYAETHPRPVHVNQVQAAAMLNVSESTISRMVRTGRLKLNRFGLIPVSGDDNLGFAVSVENRGEFLRNTNRGIEPPRMTRGGHREAQFRRCGVIVALERRLDFWLKF